MVRKQIYIDSVSEARLKNEARERGMSEAAVIRERLRGASHDDEAARLQSERAGARLIKLLDELDEMAKKQRRRRPPVKVNREEIYAARLRKARPRR